MYRIGEGGSGSSHPTMSAGGVGREEPSIREEWMQKRKQENKIFCTGCPELP